MLENGIASLDATATILNRKTSKNTPLYCSLSSLMPYTSEWFCNLMGVAARTSLYVGLIPRLAAILYIFQTIHSALQSFIIQSPVTSAQYLFCITKPTCLCRLIGNLLIW
jgi:hypothetical protein